MKTLLLTTAYQGQEIHLFLPQETNGVAFGWLVENEIQDDAVNLENIAGKKVYGELFVENVDLQTVPFETIEKLIETSNFDAFSPLLMEVERELLDYMKELQNDDDEEVHQIEHERAMLFSKYEVENSEFKIKAIYEKFIKQVEEKYLN